MMTDMFDYVDIPKAKKALRELRDFGVAKIPVAKKDVSRPFVETKFADIDIIIPAYVTDIQRAPRVHMRAFLTPQEIENCVENKGWDAEVAEELIENYRGFDYSGMNQTTYSSLRSSQARGGTTYGTDAGTDNTCGACDASLELGGYYSAGTYAPNGGNFNSLLGADLNGTWSINITCC